MDCGSIGKYLIILLFETLMCARTQILLGAHLGFWGKRLWVKDYSVIVTVCTHIFDQVFGYIHGGDLLCGSTDWYSEGWWW